MFSRKTFFISNLIVFILVLLIIKFIFDIKHEKENPTLIKAAGIKVTLNEVSETIGEKPNGPHNSLEYKKHMAPGILKNKLIDQWAKDEGLTTLEYIDKISKNADVNISEDELNKYLELNHLDRKKLSKVQLENFVNNMKGNKKQAYFHSVIDKKISEMKVEQK